MLKVPYKTIEEEGIDAFLSWNEEGMSDPYNHIICPPLEKIFEDKQVLLEFEKVCRNRFVLNKKNPSISEMTTYCIASWSFNHTSWFHIYGPNIKQYFKTGIGLHYYPNKMSENKVLLTFRGSKLFKKLRPIVQRLYKNKMLHFDYADATLDDW